MGCQSKLSKDFKVGDKVGCGTITEIHEEVGDNYAVVVCGVSGTVTKAIYNWLKVGRVCKHCRTKKSGASRTEEHKKKVKVGDIIAGREVLEIFTNKHGKSAAIVKCLVCQDPSRNREVTISELLHDGGTGCNCKLRGITKERNEVRMEKISQATVFLTSEEWKILSKYMPNRYVDKKKDKCCILCGGSEKLQLAHKIPFAVGVRDWGLTPEFLNQESNIETACQAPCNRLCELKGIEIAYELMRYGIRHLPSHLSDEVRTLMEEAKKQKDPRE